MTKTTRLENGSQLIVCTNGRFDVMSVLRDELAGFLYWLAARLEKKHKEAVVKYYAQDWPKGHGAVTTEPAPTDRSWLKFDERKVS